MKKIFFSVLIAMLTLFSTGMFAVNAEDIAVQIDGNYINFDVQPQMSNDRVLVPMRAIFEAFGAAVEWDGNTQSITAKTIDTTIHMTINSSDMTIEKSNGGNVITLDQPPIIVDGRTLVPARAVSEALDANVSWDGTNTTVNINSGKAIASSLAYFYKGNAYYSVYNEPAVYVWDGTNNYRYAAGGEPNGILVYNDYIFYYNRTTDSICRMDLDGGNRRILANATCYAPAFMIKDDNVFYTNVYEENDDWISQVCEMDINGSNKKVLAEEKGYENFDYERRLHEIKSDKILAFGKVSWIVNGDFVYYSVQPGTYESADPYRGCQFYRYNLSTGEKKNLNDTGLYESYLLQGTDCNGNIIFSDLEEENFYILDQISERLIPYSNFPQYADQWWYYGEDYTYGKGTVYRKHLVSGEYEKLADGDNMGYDNDTILFSVTKTDWDHPIYAFSKGVISQNICAMDTDGNNIRPINEYLNGSTTAINTVFDNAQSINQQATCAVCHGQGYIECSVCHGSGFLTKYYTTTFGSDDRTTTDRTCGSCGGRKIKSCIVCGGDGIIHD